MLTVFEEHCYTSLTNSAKEIAEQLKINNKLKELELCIQCGCDKTTILEEIKKIMKVA